MHSYAVVVSSSATALKAIFYTEVSQMSASHTPPSSLLNPHVHCPLIPTTVQPNLSTALPKSHSPGASPGMGKVHASSGSRLKLGTQYLIPSFPLYLHPLCQQTPSLVTAEHSLHLSTCAHLHHCHPCPRAHEPITSSSDCHHASRLLSLLPALPPSHHFLSGDTRDSPRAAWLAPFFHFRSLLIFLCFWIVFKWD